MSALALISDLAMQSHVDAAAARAGMPLEITGSTEALLAKAEVAQPHLVILDLSHPGLDPGQLVPRLVELIGPAAAILAFGPHVHEARLAAAAAAGCHSVISRGQFRAQMEQILRQYAS